MNKNPHYKHLPRRDDLAKYGYKPRPGVKSPTPPRGGESAVTTPPADSREKPAKKDDPETEPVANVR